MLGRPFTSTSSDQRARHSPEVPAQSRNASGRSAMTIAVIIPGYLGSKTPPRLRRASRGHLTECQRVLGHFQGASGKIIAGPYTLDQRSPNLASMGSIIRAGHWMFCGCGCPARFRGCLRIRYPLLQMLLIVFRASLLSFEGHQSALLAFE